MHLTSGWYKQAAVYPSLSEPWRETEALLAVLSEAHRASFQARPTGALESRASAAGRNSGNRRPGNDASQHLPRPNPAPGSALDQCPGAQ